MSIKATEIECAANATAPRVTLAALQSRIDRVYYFTPGEALDALHATAWRDGIYRGDKTDPEHVDVVDSVRHMTMAIVAMKNGFVVIGKSAPASPENFNAELGKKLAYEDAVRQIWMLEGYLLRDQLSIAAT